MRNIVSHVLRFTYRDWRSGELTLLLAALVIAVASLAAVGFFVDRLRVALDQQATQLLGGDLVVRSTRPIPPEFLAQARDRGLRSAVTVEFPSMVSADQAPRLASIKAFSQDYPLRGTWRVMPAHGAPDQAADAMPAAGEAWVDPQLADGIGASVGSLLQIGDVRLRLTRLIALEPDRGGGFVNLAPRALINDADLARSGLVQPASRLNYRFMVAGPQAAVGDYRRWVEPRLGDSQRIETVADGRPELRTTLERAEQFLSLVALLSALIAAVAVALAARRFAQRHLDASAIIKAIGFTHRQLIAVLAGELLLVALIGGLLGAALGWLLHYGLAWSIAPLLAMALPAPSLLPALHALLASIVLLLGFGAWPFMRLAGVPPLRVLRRDLGSAPASVWWGGVIALVCFGALLLWLSNDRRVALWALGGFAAGGVVFSIASALLVSAAGGARRLSLVGSNPVLRLAIASWTRRRASAIAQTVALSIGLMALALLTVTRTDLIEGWQRATPADAPNRFVINIQPDQREQVAARLQAAGVIGGELYPMVRGRLVEINGAPAEQARIDGDAAGGDRALRRELNLSYMADPPAHNRIVAGRWFDPSAREVSVEEGLMERLALKLGDRITFDIAGQRVDATVSSVRKVAWDSMKVNFFMILSPAVLGDMPQSWITAFNQPPGATIDRALVESFPNLTVFDTGLILRQVQSMLGQVVQAVQFLFLLTLAAGVAVLYGALASSRDERTREAGLMRALGASRSQLGAAQLWELGLSGGLAGLLAAAAAITVGAVLAQQVFQFELDTRWSMLPIGLGIGATLAIVAGWMGLRPVLDSPPLATLREG